MPDHPVKTTYFGVAALAAGVFCALSLLSNYGVSQVNISRETFSQLNNLTALLYCGSTQATVVLSVVGLPRKNDSRGLSWLGLALAVIPFLFVFGGLLISFLS